jgi:outer membrane lipoprotein SlyB
MKRQLTLTFAALLLLSACAPKQGQNVYKEGEVGVSMAAEYGTVRSAREVQIDAKNTGIGTLGGAAVGAGAGSYVGSGSGNTWATAGAAVAGAVIGTVIESQLNDRKGMEYTVAMQNGETKIIVQEIHEGDEIFRRGQKVMMQYCDGGNDHNKKCASGSSYQRLYPVDSFPAYTKKKRKVVKG